LLKLKLLVLPLLLLIPAGSAADSVQLRFDAVVLSAAGAVASAGENFTGTFWYEPPGKEPFRSFDFFGEPAKRHLDYTIWAGGIQFDLAFGRLASLSRQEIELTDYVRGDSSESDQLVIRGRHWFRELEIVLGGDGSSFFESVGITAPVIPAALAQELPFLDYAWGTARIRNFLGEDFVAAILPGSIRPWSEPLRENLMPTPEPSGVVLVLLGLCGLSARARRSRRASGSNPASDSARSDSI